MPSNINRSIIAASMDSWIEAIRQDNRRSLRRLVELGAMFSTNKSFFDLAFHMLDDRDSAYYHLIGQLAERVDKARLKCFGLNFGYNDLTTGVLPAFLHCPDEETFRMALEEAKATDQQAFVLFLGQAFVPQEEVPDNVLLSLPWASSCFSDAAKALDAGGYLWSAHLSYGEQEAATVFSSDLCRALIAQSCPFCFFLADESVTPASRQLLYQQISKKRTEQRTALFPIELESDLAYIKGSVS